MISEGTGRVQLNNKMAAASVQAVFFRLSTDGKEKEQFPKQDHRENYLGRSFRGQQELSSGRENLKQLYQLELKRAGNTEYGNRSRIPVAGLTLACCQVPTKPLCHSPPHWTGER